MKKLVSLLLALIVCLAAVGATAETIPVEEMLLDNGLCFVAPSQWEETGLTDEDYAEGYLLLLMDIDTGRCMGVNISDVDESVTNQELIDAMNSDSTYLSAQLVTNEHGVELVLYAYADETVVGYVLLDGEGKMYSFTFLNAEDKRISSDDALLALVDTCMADTYLDEEMALYANDDDVITGANANEQPTVQGSVPLTMVGIKEGPNFPVPSQWKEVEPTDAEKKDGCVAIYTDETTSRTMVIMANELGDITTAELAEAMQQDSEYIAVRLMTNGYGQEMVLYVSADQATGGYCFVEDGWMYAMIYGVGGGAVMTNDEVLAQLVQDCMNNTYFD